MWTRAKGLAFKDTDRFLIDDKPDFTGFVDWVLAHRGNHANLESLEIHITGKNGHVVSREKVSEWLLYAARHVVKSVNIYQEPSALKADSDEQQQQAAVVELPISLHLPGYRFRLPVAGRYEVLTKLELLSLSFHEEGGTTLGEFVASCCPRLRRLHMIDPKGLRHLALRSDVLEEFDIAVAADLQKLEVVAPNLRVVRLSACFTWLMHPLVPGSNDAGAIDKLVRIAAPKLEEIGSMHYLRNKPSDLDIHDLRRVRRLTELHLDLHGKYHSGMDVGSWLLKNCPSVEHVDVSLYHNERCKLAVDEKLVELTASEGKAPFAKLRTMAVRAYCFPKHHFVASILSLLSRSPHLTALGVGISSTAEKSYRCFCDALTDRWAIDHGKIALESLEVVEINGFSGRDEEMQLVRLLFESSSSIKHMVLERIPSAKVKKMGEQQPSGQDAETICQELMKNSCANRGRWRLSKKAFTWTS